MMSVGRFAVMALVFAVVAAASPGSADASILVKWDFNDNDAVADQILPGVTSTSFLDGGSLNVTINQNAAARGWNPSASAAAAKATGDYWTFTVTAALGSVLDLTSLTFDQRRETNGPISFQVYLGNTLIGSAGSAGLVSANYSANLTGNNGLASATLYIVAWDAQNNGGTANWLVDNVTLNGTLREVQGTGQNIVPEPTSLALMGFAAFGFAARALRRRQSTAA